MAKQYWRTTLIFWGLHLTGWGLFFYAQYTGELILAGSDPVRSLEVWAPFCLTSVAMTQGLRIAAKRFSWFELSQSALLARIVVGTAIIATTSCITLSALSELFYGHATTPLVRELYIRLPARDQYVNQCIFVCASHLAWIALYFAISTQRHRYAARLQRLQMADALRSAELRLLKSQLNPHFLFNALNSVRALIAVEPGTAQDAVTKLSRILRYSLSSSDEDLLSVAREMEMVDDYLGLEALRLGDRLKVVRNIDPASLHKRVPAMLIQTLVENAIKHGISQLNEGGIVEIGVELGSTAMKIEVINPYPKATPSQEQAGGSGLKNLAERLRHFWGASAHLDLRISHGNAVVIVSVPV